MSDNPFNSGDDVALVYRNYRYGEVLILWRGKVEKVHKTGAVITEKGKFRADGRPYGTTLRYASSPQLEHITSELLAETSRSESTRRAQNDLRDLADKLAKMRSDDAIAMAEKLRDAGIIGGDA